MNIFKSLRSLPRWYTWTLLVLFICYLGGWAYTIHLAHLQQVNGATVILPVEPHDSTSYANLAQSLLHGHFAEPGEVYEYFHTPGYPALVAAILWVTGGSYFAVTLVQILLVFAVALMTYVIGKTLLSERVGRWASLLFLINPLVPYIALVVLTDTLFTFLLTLGFMLLLVHFAKRPLLTAVLAGLVFAAAVYVRPIGFIALPIFVAPLLAVALPWKQKLVYAATMLAIIGVLLVPWMLRNKEHSGVFSFSSTFPLNMAYYEIPHYLAWHNHMTIGDGIKKVEADSGVPQGTDTNGYPANWYNLASAPQLDHYIYQTILEHPVSYATWHIYNSSAFFLNPAVNPLGGRTINLKLLLAHGQILAVLKEASTPWWLFVERILIFVGLALIAAGVWSLRKRLFVWVFLFIILYFAVLGGPSATSRLRLPVEPLLSILMVAGLLFVMYGTRMETTSAKEGFDSILADLDFHQSIISRSKGRLRKYPLRTTRYVIGNAIWKMRIALGHSALIPAKTFWGDTMQVVFPTYRSIYHFGLLDSWELLVEKALVTNLEPGDTFVDIGANVGFYTLLGSSLVGTTGHVHAFEPTPSTFALLTQNTKGKQNIHLNQLALGSAKGEATLADFGLFESGLNSMVRLEQNGLTSQKITVPVVTLDGYCKEKNIVPKMCKIDAEGMELEILKGATETLQKAKPVLVLEIGPLEESAELLNFVIAHGYKGYYANEKMEFVAYDTNYKHGRINMVFVAG